MKIRHVSLILLIAMSIGLPSVVQAECTSDEILSLIDQNMSNEEIESYCNKKTAQPTPSPPVEKTPSVAPVPPPTPIEDIVEESQDDEFATIESEEPETTDTIQNWYFKIGTNVIFTFGLGPEIDAVLGQIEGLVSGREVEMELLHLRPKMRMFADEEIKRTDTNVLPTINLGFGKVSGRHRYEFDFGVFGLLALNTINVKTALTMDEGKVCGSSNANDCPMANMEFVDSSTGKGQYDLHIVLNEEIWILAPSVYYDYTFWEPTWGQLSLGSSFGLIYLTLIQKIDMSIQRTDVVDPVFGPRKIEASALSTAINEFGPIIRLYTGLRSDVLGTTDIRLGVNYGFVNINRDVDGAGTAFIGNGLAVSFPLSAMSVDGTSFSHQEENKVEFKGFYIHFGVVF